MRKVNEIVVWALLSEQGALAHRFLALAETPGSGTDRPICGIAKMCDAALGSIASVVLPFRMKVPPPVPWACEMNGLRRPVCVSYL